MGRIFISCRIFPDEIARLEREGHEVEMYPGDVIPREELLRGVAGADVLICPLSTRVDRDILAASPRLKIIANLGVGVDNIDLDEASARGIMVLNTPGVLTETVADLAVALMLAVARRIAELDKRLRAEGFPGWSFMPPYLGRDVWGSTLGIVGLGRIGAAVARRARCFSMAILYYSRARKPDLEAELGCRYVPLDELLAESDFVVLCVPLVPETRHLIGERELSLMKETAYLVNIARGPVVDEGALVRALREGRIAGAALDVFEREPEVHPGLLELDNVVLTPHIGSATLGTRRRMASLAVDGVLAALRGERPGNLVNPNAWPGKL
ncbi:MAG: D-glycerate dehydrogenase [Caldiserica bacterium]|nr:D-glycerate dehydrogenase [Caldisericota bacterium]